ncbi:MAG: hypothetical protein ACQESF_04635 [Nanobdellota archaeon]
MVKKNKKSFFDIVRFEGEGNRWCAYLRQDTTETKKNTKKE